MKKENTEEYKYETVPYCCEKTQKITRKKKIEKFKDFYGFFNDGIALLIQYRYNNPEKQFYICHPDTGGGDTG